MAGGTTLKIEGMSCNHCVRSVKGALAELPGVKSVEVDLKSGTATIDAENLDLKLAKETVERLGFKCP